MLFLPPAAHALIKALSLGYLLTLLGMLLATGLWRVLRPRINPALRADAGFLLLVGAWLLNTLLAAGIWWGVVSHRILMTTNYFHHLMYGGWANAITGTGLMVLGASLMLLALGWQRGIVPQRLKGTAPLGASPRGLTIRPASGISTAALVGVLRPEIWVSELYWQSLSPADRELALAHEEQHLRRRDNLRKLLLGAIGGLFAILPGGRAWAARYEADSELAVDDACRRNFDEGAYRGLIADALRHALSTQRESGATPAAGAALLRSELAAAPAEKATESGLLERLRLLAAPRLTGKAGAALALACGLAALSCLPSLALLCHPVPRCLLACYLGY